ncbi:IS66 family transposase [bacterium]|nr:IS66 family transposase [bacterium]
MKEPSEPSEQLREVIRAAYRQGEEAVIALVENLLKAQAEAIGKLESRIKVLEDQANKDSRNSSKPPSGDGFKKRPQSLRTKSGRKSGGQAGHPGSTLEWVDVPDEIEQQVIETCQGCGASLEEMPIVEWQCAQVHDLVPIEMRVREHQVAVKQCECCGQRNQAAFPVGVTNRVQYGSRLRSLMVYLMDYQLLPSARVQELLSEVLGCSLSEGTLYETRQACFELLSEIEASIFEALQQAKVAHFDETGLRVNGKLMWLHVASTQALTYYFIHPKRGSEAIDAMDILPQFEGTSVHDGWRSYALYSCVHALCNAHHLRELRFLVERDGQEWAEQMMTLLVTMKASVEQAQAQGQTQLNAEAITQFEPQYRDLIEIGMKLNPANPPVANSRGRPKQSPARNLLERLETHQAEVLRFIHDFQVPFDNNQAERDIRMMKLKQKISGGFRSAVGAQIFGRVRGYLSTLKKQGYPILDALEQLFWDIPFP